jgi:hypothetical protein
MRRPEVVAHVPSHCAGGGCAERAISQGSGAFSMPVNRQSGRDIASRRSNSPVPQPRSTRCTRPVLRQQPATASAPLPDWSGTAVRWVRKVDQNTADSPRKASRYQNGAMSSARAPTTRGEKTQVDGDPPAWCAGSQAPVRRDACLHDDDGQHAGWRRHGIAQCKDGNHPRDELDGERTEQVHVRIGLCGNRDLRKVIPHGGCARPRLAQAICLIPVFGCRRAARQSRLQMPAGGVFERGEPDQRSRAVVTAHVERRLEPRATGGALRRTENGAPVVGRELDAPRVGRFAVRHARYGARYRWRDAAGTAALAAVDHPLRSIHAVHWRSSSERTGAGSAAS